jgi:hypothetical protein
LRGTKIDITPYPGATHDFDDPGEKRQGVRGNPAAKADASNGAAGVMEGRKNQEATSLKQSAGSCNP